MPAKVDRKELFIIAGTAAGVIAGWVGRSFLGDPSRSLPDQPKPDTELPRFPTPVVASRPPIPAEAPKPTEAVKQMMPPAANLEQKKSPTEALKNTYNESIIAQALVQAKLEMSKSTGTHEPFGFYLAEEALETVDKIGTKIQFVENKEHVFGSIDIRVIQKIYRLLKVFDEYKLPYPNKWSPSRDSKYDEKTGVLYFNPADPYLALGYFSAHTNPQAVKVFGAEVLPLFDNNPFYVYDGGFFNNVLEDRRFGTGGRDIDLYSASMAQYLQGGKDLRNWIFYRMVTNRKNEAEFLNQLYQFFLNQLNFETFMDGALDGNADIKDGEIVQVRDLELARERGIILRKDPEDELDRQGAYVLHGEQVKVLGRRQLKIISPLQIAFDMVEIEKEETAQGVRNEPGGNRGFIPTHYLAPIPKS